MPPKKADTPENNFINMIKNIRDNNPNIDKIELYKLFSEKLIAMSGGIIEGFYIKHDIDNFVITLRIFGWNTVCLFICIDLREVDYITFSPQTFEGYESKKIKEFNELYDLIVLELKRIYITTKDSIIVSSNNIKEKLKRFNISVDDSPAE